jgi:hypothetical protein
MRAGWNEAPGRRFQARAKGLLKGSARIELGQWKLRAKYCAPQICLNLEPAAATYVPEAV